MASDPSPQHPLFPAGLFAPGLSSPEEGLPVAEALPRLRAALHDGANAVLVAPPGAGKTTLVPLALLAAPWRGDGRIVMLEPRRLAARAAARRMADLIGEEPGGLIGYRTRLDGASSPATRIEVVTEGLLVRRLLSDPTLEGVACVIFDEIHERSVDADAALAFCLDLQRELRPDLRLVAMSATTDAATLSQRMEAPIIESAGRMFPVDIRHARRDIPHQRDLPDAMARAIRTALAEEEGDILAFLPGVGEIRRTQAALSDVGAEVLPLYGELPPAEQDYVLRADTKAGRRVILSTSIAETSLTVPGVRIVIDGGFRRTPRLDAGTGLTKLETARISRAAATQRAGRAGREAPGIAIRLWSETTSRAMPPHDRPEIMEAELTGLRLDTAAWQAAMGTVAAELPFADTPPNGAFEAARSLLIALGALSEDGRITQAGVQMAQLGSHPRLAAMMLAARTPEEAALAADLAALLEERDPLRPRPSGRGPGGNAIPPADIRLRLDLIAGGDHPAADRGALSRIRQAARQYRRRMGIGRDVVARGDCAALLAAAFPDRIAQRRGDVGTFRLSGGGSARMGKTDTLASASLLAVAGMHVRTACEIRLAAPLDPDNLPDSVLARTHEQVETTIDPATDAVMARRRLRLGALVLRDRTVTADATEVAGLLLQQVGQNLAAAFEWTDACRQLQARVAWARDVLGRTDLPDLSDAALAADVEGWLGAWVGGMSRMSEIRALDLLAVLRAMIPHDALRWLDRTLPPALDLPGGRVGIDYLQPVPLASARAQTFYGQCETPKLADGRIGLRIALLSPAGRPQAITADLAGFWAGSWADMRRDMRGRYPRHDWPEDPAHAQPSQRPARRKT
ncbi:ATP-dependent helicase HrpB [Gluconacetobacter entanii]|uniref:ATP-dependent helicase HrpB n=1 Tax=Gluconacetobacter entanii TaxID=108528 RepID=UPI001C932C40|nr:ATP-dependent helicase HrpB [Gluconacetobacter entanii]MBY4641129.1 ATP-dependent helicase HrpB [Gluconacetobacter entanii]MCW4580649.1 ATP-dependent helicase HrpB [Gluconacetobacter entanii]MCW4583961.1 ATP-dependent helicase HrpB [Gluconacetobacter entanii]MCW4587323.1 ATP-dependent helicase HrpB [Gluconacetobacter entanii]